MKKALLILIILSATVTTWAQEPTVAQEASQKKHYLELSVGGPAGGPLLFTDDRSYYSRNGYTLKNLYEDQVFVEGTVVLGVQYGYHVTSWLNVGVEGGWGLVSAEVSPGLAYQRNNQDDSKSLFQNHFSLLPSASFWWAKYRYIGLYSRVSAGAYLSIGEYQPATLNFAYEIVPLAVYIGNNTLYLFGEVGVGTYYIARYGIGFSL